MSGLSHFAVAGAMTLHTPRLRRRCHELSNYSAVAEGSVATELLSCMRHYTFSRSRCRKQVNAFFHLRSLRLRRLRLSLRLRFYVVLISL